MKALVIAHGHPDFSVGGAEIAAFNHFKALQRRGDVERAVFLARSDQKSLSHGAIMLRRTDEYLWRQDISDWFRLRCANLTALNTTFTEFLTSIAPDVVYVHHYAGMGVEILRQIRRTLPACRLVLTLHEYMAICNKSGQMVKNNSLNLCYRETPEECSACFPERSPQDFWLRKHYIQRHFEACDHFVSPSEFLRQRYIDWGIPADSISVIENGQPTFALDAQDDARAGRVRNRFGFFGQVTPFKGVDLVLQAMHLMRPEQRAQMIVEIHGANLEHQEKTLKENIERLRAPLIVQGCLRWIGGYEQRELHRRMSKVDWVMVPSIWWENSPMVIQEAFSCRRPVIAANIGGMAEKVRHGITGLHFEARNAVDLADVMTQAVTEAGLWQRLVGNIRQPPTYDEAAAEYLSLLTR